MKKKALRQLEYEIKHLAAEQAIEYNKLHKGKTNAAQSRALKELRITQKSAESIYLSEFARDQEDYFKLKQASENTWATMRRLQDENKVPNCIPSPTHEDYGAGCNFTHEKYCYLLMEILEGKHNEFLKRIIGKDK